MRLVVTNSLLITQIVALVTRNLNVTKLISQLTCFTRVCIHRSCVSVKTQMTKLRFTNNSNSKSLSSEKLRFTKTRFKRVYVSSKVAYNKLFHKSCAFSILSSQNDAQISRSKKSN